ncbi:hypothetical protein Tco_0126366 [Tanacetum coccineum]
MFKRISIERYSKHTTLTKMTFSPHMVRSGKEESSKEATQKESKSTSSSKGNDDVSPAREATYVDEQLWNPSGSRTPDREWNQTKTVDDRPPQ